MDLWVRFIERLPKGARNVVGSFKMPSELIPGLGDQVNIDGHAWFVSEREYANLKSSENEKLFSDPDIIHMYIGVDRPQGPFDPFDPNVSRH